MPLREELVPAFREAIKHDPWFRKYVRTGACFRNDHPTVKSVALMEWLCRITETPTGGVVLDPFAGSGTTLVACVRTRRRFVGVDDDAHYCEIARWRVEAARRETAQLVMFEE